MLSRLVWFVFEVWWVLICLFSRLCISWLVCCLVVLFGSGS